MLIAFIGWSLIACALAAIGAYAWCAGKPVGFFAGVDAPKVHDVRGYNRTVARIWWIFAALFELLGLPLLKLRQNSPLVLLLVLGTVLWSLGLMVAYVVTTNKFQKK